MIRFSSTTVPFAVKSYQLAEGEALTAETLAALVGANAEAKETAVVCRDRPTLIAATKAFRAAMGIAPKAPAVEWGPAETSAQAPVVRWGRTEVVPMTEVEALKAEVASLKQQLGEALAQVQFGHTDEEVAAIIAELNHLRERNTELENRARPRSRAKGSRIPAA